MSSSLRAIPKVGTRYKQWLIINDAGGLVAEFTGTKAQAEAKAKRLGERKSLTSPPRSV